MNNKFSMLFLSLILSTGITACGGGGDNDDSESDPTPSSTPSGADPTPTTEPVADADFDDDGVNDDVDNCVDIANADQRDSDVNGEGDACDPMPTTYTFESQIIQSESAVSYTGQTKRHVLISNLNRDIANTAEDGTADPADILANTLNFYFRYDGTADDLPHEKVAGDGTFGVIPVNYGDISSGKSLVGKIAGNDRPEHIIGGEFFGWETGLDDSPTPEELVDYFFTEYAAEATNGVGHNGSTKAYLSATGLDYKQLIQKFLLGAITLSQGTADYLQTDWSAENVNENEDVNDPAPYTASEHNWDEAFGYFGAARDYNTAFTDDELAAGDLVDTNNDSNIDLRSEYSFGNSVNCAKRDRATASLTNPTSFTQDAYEAFIIGRQILNNASANIGEDLTAEQLAALDVQITIVAQTWEKCVAATVIHYINDVIDDMDEFNAGDFADTENFENIAKHWSEMKGFALGLQFNPESPFRASDDTLMDLKEVLSIMGDAPVLPDGTQAGVAFDGGVAAYRENLLDARLLMQTIYEFDAENVAAW